MSVAKRPRFSRWRRLPGVYRFGEKSRPQPKLEPERLTLYLPWELLDVAEAQAAQLGIPTIQEYCTLVLERGLDAERIKSHVADIEAQRGTLEGLHEIADDPEYLAEWSAQVQARERTEPVRIEPPPDTMTVPVAGVEPAAAPAARALDAAAQEVTYAEPAVLETGLSPAAEVVLRHAAQGGEGPSLLASLRRGESVSVAEVAELARALHVLETELQGSSTLDRRLVYALHRLAFESQVLHTDAFPGAFDDWTVDTLRAVQEAVDRVLSGQDIRYAAPNPRPEIPL
jgi:hypothetical protein